ncbi:DMT family transporter [Azospirillum agricola]|uniref:DMT family transporter n=1 Tax=Azospirillum agricola TaxID=1720247 RepID=UPI000A0F165E|nr:DMT family transporter [Azospirillum agricola]SMH62937.1 Permease of the drug/metabolite transporter (DMT) superfamily [Azospirillum lipoferum]
MGREGGFLLLSSLLFCCSDVFIKLLTQEMPLGEFMVLRALACIVFFLAVMPRTERSGVLRHAGNRFVLMRSLFEAGSVTCFILALQALPTATVSSIYMTGPVFTVCIAAALGMTRLNWRLATSVAIAFAGVLLVALPREAGLTEAVALAFVSAILVAGRDLVTRGMPAGIPSMTVALVTMVGVGLAGAMLGPWGAPWMIIGPGVAGMLLLGAMFTAGGNYLIIVAYRTGDPGLMSVLRYASIPMAMVVGGIVFGHVPYPLQFLGAGMVILGGSIAMGRGRSRS